MGISLLSTHLLSTCYMPDPGLSPKVTEMKDPILLSCCTVFISSLTEGTWGAWGTWRIVISSTLKAFLEELKPELSLEEWVEVRRKHRKWIGGLWGEKGSVRRINCGGETGGRACFKTCAWFYITNAERVWGRLRRGKLCAQ